MAGTAAELGSESGLIFDIQRYAVHDGPGIRTLVFLSGCPLSCLWCQNPEGRHMRPVMLRYQARCTSCQRCVQVCPHEAVVLAGGNGFRPDASRCTLCGLCVEECPAEARTIAGRMATAAEILRTVEQDRAFYRRSGGGITLSGGDPLMQPSFARAILSLCRENHIGTALETCGYADAGVARSVAGQADTVLYDLKHIDPGEHRRLTGVDNELILDNARLISRMDLSLVIRIPIIPGCNDDESTLSSMAEFIRSLDKVSRVELLPYHRLGESKYHALGEEYPLEHIPDPRPERMESLRRLMDERGVHASIQGFMSE